MTWVLLLISTIAIVECFIRFPISTKLKNFSEVIWKAIRIVRSSSVSDHWKEKILPHYALSIFVCSIDFFIALLFRFSPLILALLICFTFDHQFAQFLISWQAILVSIFGAFLYLVIRKYVFY